MKFIVLGVSPARCPFILPKSKYSPQCYPDVQPPLPCPSLGVTDIYSMKLSWNQFSGFEMKRGQMKATVARLILLWTLCKERKSAAVYCNCLCVSLFHIIYEYLMRYNIKIRTFTSTVANMAVRKTRFITCSIYCKSHWKITRAFLRKNSKPNPAIGYHTRTLAEGQWASRTVNALRAEQL
jgi:hypothetical protein